MLVDVPEWVQPMRVVKMRVAPEHLLHDALAVFVERLGKSTGLSDPLIPGATCTRASGMRTSSLVNCKGLRHAVDFVRGEHDGVVNLAHNPFLNAVDEFRSRDFRSAAIHKPGISQTGK